MAPLRPSKILPGLSSKIQVEGNYDEALAESLGSDL
jgi:hypothetical protein